MKKIKAFWHVFKNSFDPKYYKDVLKAPFGFSLKYYFFYFLLFGLGVSIYAGVRYFRPLSVVLGKLPDKIVQYYPEDLVFQIKDGKVSSNYENPVIIPFDMVSDIAVDLDERLGSFDYSQFQNIVVVDTNAQIEDFEKYETMILVTDSNVVTVGENSTYQVNSLAEANDFNLNINVVKEGVEVLKPIMGYLPVFFSMILFWVMVGIVPMALMIYLVFYALCMMIGSRIAEKKLTFGKSFQIGMHLQPIWILAMALVSIAQWRFKVPFMNSLFLLVYSMLILKEIRVKNKVE